MARDGSSVLIVILLVLVSYSEADFYSGGKFGKLYTSCTHDDDCSYKDKQVPEMACKDGWCDCNEPRYTLFITPNFYSFQSNRKAHLSCKELKNAYFYRKMKKEELVCKNYTGENHCLCPNGTYYIEQVVLNGCKNISFKGLSSYCGYDNYCDFKKSLECVRSSCKCKRNMMYDFDKKICIEKSTYMEENNLTRYRVTHGVYCSADSDCMEGLECKNDFSCHCPGYCKYDKKRIACDCGEVEVEVEFAPILVGVIGGFFIILFWWMVIKKSVLEHRDKMTISRVPLNQMDCDPAPSSVPDGPLPYSAAPGPNPNLAYPSPSAPLNITSDSASAWAGNSSTPVGFSASPMNPPSYDEAVKGTKE